jgi:TorA maturation chaperone TorD
MNTPHETDDPVQREALAEARRNTYAYLSQAFLSEPTEDLVSGFLDEALLSSLPGSEREEDQHPLRSFAATYDGNLETLSHEFNALFVTPIRGAYAPPFASVYLAGMMGQEPTRAARRFYLEAGLEIDEGNSMAPDHIGMELEFMATLCQREMTALAEGSPEDVRGIMAMERSFLKDHLLPWIPQLSEEIFIKGTSDFYKGVSQFLKDYVSFDKDLVDDLLGNREE